MSLAAANLTNRRDAILPGELGKGQLYRMPSRRVPADPVWESFLKPHLDQKLYRDLRMQPAPWLGRL